MPWSMEKVFKQGALFPIGGLSSILGPNQKSWALVFVRIYPTSCEISSIDLYSKIVLYCPTFTKWKYWLLDLSPKILSRVCAQLLHALLSVQRQAFCIKIYVWSVKCDSQCINGMLFYPSNQLFDHAVLISEDLSSFKPKNQNFATLKLYFW